MKTARITEVKALDWEEEDDLLFAVLFRLILAVIKQSAEESVAYLVATAGVGVDWGVVNTAAVEFARNYTYDLVKNINGTTRAFLQKEIPAWIESGQPISVLTDTLSPMFGAVRAEMIAVTETTRAFAAGNDVVWKESGIVEEFDVYTSEDDYVCPICNGVADKNPYKLGDPEGQPPFHVRCRCIKHPRIIGSI